MTEKEIRQKFVNMAVSYLGTKEGSEKHKFIVDSYNCIRPLPVGYVLKTSDAWCAAFTSAMAYLCNLLDVFPAECSCNRQIELAKKMGIWVENDAYVPQPADLVLYDWNDSGAGDNTGGSEHVGIVVSVANGVIKVVEGNCDNAVNYRNIKVNGRYIRGYICPRYAAKASKEQPVVTKPTSSAKDVGIVVNLKVLKKGDKSDMVRAMQMLLVGNGCSVGKSGADGIFGEDTYKAVKKYQGRMRIAQDGIVGKNTWSMLLGNSILGQ